MCPHEVRCILCCTRLCMINQKEETCIVTYYRKIGIFTVCEDCLEREDSITVGIRERMVRGEYH